MAATMRAQATRVAPTVSLSARRNVSKGLARAAPVKATRAGSFAVRAAAAEDTNLGFKTMRSGIKEAADENLLTPRFYTTDFDEMEKMFNEKMMSNLDMAEFEATLKEFQEDYNQKHFVRNDEFKAAADNIQGPTRKIFIEFLERSCTAEFSGFLLYKELGRRLKKSSPIIAEIFTLMSRDEARHAGFLNKAMSDFNLALDLGFLTKNRKYTFFKPKFIFYATYLSEKIGYWRYISIYRHLQRNPDQQLYPIFKYFENWCQDESRHGDFFTAILKNQKELVDPNDWEAKLWSRFFCISVYVTMYLNDHSRSSFYESVGLNTTEFNQHVIIETNRTTSRIFPETIDVENPDFFKRLDALVVTNTKLAELSKDKSPLAALQKIPVIATFAVQLIQILLMKPVESGAYDFIEDSAVVY
uniref:magnesium-protoporphyrin IX monomethyl ester (oxidative) cyclase n=1 Tax=Pyramimonas obovata TaxID=1411642 RepID=A0A7S0WI92_9CHLO|mmetsp:Transcript_26080/g.56548  ORF Transcript_26080/g.56548 Transcript_26080/m.56548 type:complete len:415 (+) Transcript_26080:128-1372(+)